MIDFTRPPQPVYDPRSVVITAKLTCPKCGKCQFRTEPQSGRLFMTCETRGSKVEGRSECKQEWWCVALPPNATGLDLAHALGELSAAALIRRAIPAARDLPDDALWPLLLTGPDAPAYVQVVVRPRERYLHRRALVHEMLEALGVL